MLTDFTSDSKKIISDEYSCHSEIGVKIPKKVNKYIHVIYMHRKCLEFSFNNFSPNSSKRIREYSLNSREMLGEYSAKFSSSRLPGYLGNTQTDTQALNKQWVNTYQVSLING